MLPARLRTNFPHYLINGTIFNNKLFKNKMSVLIFSTTLSQTFLILEINKRSVIKGTVYIGLHVKLLLLLSEFKETCFPRSIIEKYSNMKFHDVTFSVIPVVACRQKDGQKERQTRRS
jgi:hypothetical protein